MWWIVVWRSITWHCVTCCGEARREVFKRVIACWESLGIGVEVELEAKLSHILGFRLGHGFGHGLGVESRGSNSATD